MIFTVSFAADELFDLLDELDDDDDDVDEPPLEPSRFSSPLLLDASFESPVVFQTTMPTTAPTTAQNTTTAPMISALRLGAAGAMVRWREREAEAELRLGTVNLRR